MKSMDFLDKQLHEDSGSLSEQLSRIQSWTYRVYEGMLDTVVHGQSGRPSQQRSYRACSHASQSNRLEYPASYREKYIIRHFLL